MVEVFWPEEVVRLPEDAGRLGLKRGALGKIIHTYPNRPHMADVEFPRDGEKPAVAILTKDPELCIVGFYPL